MGKINKEKLRVLPVIDLNEIYLRPVKYEDYKDMFEYGSDPLVTKSLTWKYNKVEDAEISVKRVFISRPDRGLPSAYAIIHKADNKMIGTCDFHSVDWKENQGEIGYVINRKYWGKGFMTLACKALIKFGFEYLELDKVVISHRTNNIGSQRVIEKSGFKFISEKIHPKHGKLNRFYEITEDDYYSFNNYFLDC